MVQIIDLPQRYQDVMGQQMAQGVGRNFAPPEYYVQQQMQAGALDKFKNMLTPNDSQADRTLKFMQATAGLPNQSELANVLLPQLNQQYMRQRLGMGGAFPQQMQNVQQTQQQPMQGQQMPNQPMMPNQLQSFSYGNVFSPQQGGGMMPTQSIAAGTGLAPQGQSGLRDLATEIALQQGGDLTQVPALMKSLSQLPESEINSALQTIALNNSNEKLKYARQKLPENTPEKELNDFVRIGQKYNRLAPEEWFAATDRDFKKYQNKLKNFENGFTPGVLSGMLKGKEFREKSLDRLHILAKPLIDLGEDEAVRSILSDPEKGLNLTKTEIERTIHPPSKDMMKKVSSFLKAPYEPFASDVFSYEEAQQKSPKLIDQYTNKMADFIKNNVDENTSLTNLRYELGKKKGVDWRNFYDALNMAINNGMMLSHDQEGELGELTKPPMDSLADIFFDWGRIIPYMKGQK